MFYSYIIVFVLVFYNVLAPARQISISIIGRDIYPEKGGRKEGFIILLSSIIFSYAIVVFELYSLCFILFIIGMIVGFVPFKKPIDRIGVWILSFLFLFEGMLLIFLKASVHWIEFGY